MNFNLVSAIRTWTSHYWHISEFLAYSIINNLQARGISFTMFIDWYWGLW